MKTTEQIARETLFGEDENHGLALETFTLTAPSNDNNAMPWQAAELKFLEMAHVCGQVVAQIQRRTLTPFPKTETPAFLRPLGRMA